MPGRAGPRYGTGHTRYSLRKRLDRSPAADILVAAVVVDDETIGPVLDAEPRIHATQRVNSPTILRHVHRKRFHQFDGGPVGAVSPLIRSRTLRNRTASSTT